MTGSFFQTANITIVCLIYIVIIQIMFWLKNNKRRLATRVFISLIIITIISMITLIIWAHLSSISSPYNNIIGRLNCCIMLCWNTTLVMYLSIVFKTNDEILALSNKLKNTKYIMAASVFSIVAFLSVFLDFNTIYLESSQMYVMSGMLFTGVSILGAASIVYAIIMLYINRKKLDKTTLVICIVTVLICSLSIVTEMLGYTLNDMNFLFTVVILFLYLAIEGQDKTLLDDYNEYNKKATESINLKNDFIMNMSHQLRTPMNTILGFSEILLTSNNLAQSELIDNSNSIEIASKKLMELINSILDISKLESEKEVIKNVDYNLDTVIYDISSNINSKIDKGNLIFTINANENCPNDLNGDEYKIAKVLNIVISNAVKHTNYGEVSLNVSSSQVDQENHEIVFHIKNTGHAMKTEDFNRSFEDLIKLTSNSNNDIDSDTLKIIVAKRLVEMMNGTIEFINEKGQGTQYIIKIKQKVLSQNQLGNIKEKIQTKHAISYEKINLLGKKALIIDDEKVNTIILQRLLNQYNIEIEATTSPREGIDKVTNETYDIVFVNHRLNEMSGEDVINKLESTGNRLPPIVGLINGISDIKETNDYTETINCPIEFKELNKILTKIFSV